MNPDTTPTPRWEIKMSEDGHHYLWDDRKYDNYDLGSLCRILNEYEDKTNEVARLREELDRFKRGCQGSCYACEPVGEMNLKLEAEVARLRELLNRAILLLREYNMAEALALEAQLTPAPEEPNQLTK